MKISLIQKDLEGLELVEPLWYCLRDHHTRISPTFSESIANNNFQRRSKQIKEKARTGNINICLVLDEETEDYVGYCISSINESLEGEIDSIYIIDAYRKQGLGSLLMKNALEWFQSHNIEDISISVMYGNESAFLFYEKYGFYLRTYNLKNKK
ncbi:GNAT family N-acetyltransferase [Paenibacillus rhizophilus]|uniref:GNAT family N-acetyltransferase n=1 Tax=Paenibacillus rhizophilus TaxID=1850366 RepID=A0A3N9PAA4_9BACL|nr:GNAT family N-acetyltransferase [Paenibacillus rhizophilus]RQW12257.1 GNAT family N-acetyltransferase [Paenibacillus rhizophilus]